MKLKHSGTLETLGCNGSSVWDVLETLERTGNTRTDWRHWVVVERVGLADETGT